MPDLFNRNEMDEMLFEALRTIFTFERTKVALFNLTYAEIYLLQFLRRKQGLMMNEVAAEMQIPVSTTTRLIGRLEKRGLLSRRKDQGDYRKKKVFLETAGQKLVKEVEEHTYQIIVGNLKKYGAEEVGCFINTAVELKHLLLKND